MLEDIVEGGYLTLVTYRDGNGLFRQQTDVNMMLISGTVGWVKDFFEHDWIEETDYDAMWKGRATVDELCLKIRTAILKEWKEGARNIETTEMVLRDAKARLPAIIRRQQQHYRFCFTVAEQVISSLRARNLLAANYFFSKLWKLPTEKDVQEMVERLAYGYQRNYPNITLAEYPLSRQQIISQNLTYDLILLCEQKRWGEASQESHMCLDPEPRKEVAEARIINSIVSDLRMATTTSRIVAFFTGRPLVADIVTQLCDALRKCQERYLAQPLQQMSSDMQMRFIHCVQLSTVDTLKFRHRPVSVLSGAIQDAVKSSSTLQRCLKPEVYCGNLNMRVTPVVSPPVARYAPSPHILKQTHAEREIHRGTSINSISRASINK